MEIQKVRPLGVSGGTEYKIPLITLRTLILLFGQLVGYGIRRAVSIAYFFAECSRRERRHTTLGKQSRETEFVTTEERTGYTVFGVGKLFHDTTTTTLLTIRLVGVYLISAVLVRREISHTFSGYKVVYFEWGRFLKSSDLSEVCQIEPHAVIIHTGK